jgi:DNA-directed RNA polymerase subunit RPC12/RpoP
MESRDHKTTKPGQSSRCERLVYENRDDISNISLNATPIEAWDIVRCSRCQYSLGIDTDSPSCGGAIRFGMNSYYCTRCAKAVGLTS